MNVRKHARETTTTSSRACFVAVVALALAGCSSGQPSAGGAYTSGIKAAAGQATSDFERQVLVDGAITRQEYEEAFQRYVSCGKQHGVDIGLVDQGGWYISSMRTSPNSDQVDSQCSQGTIALIGGLYEQTVRNPNKGDVDELEFKCLVNQGVAPPGYTLTQYKLDKKSEAESGPNITVGQSGNAAGPAGHSFGAPPANPYPFDNADLRYAACINNPAAPPTG